MVDLVRSDLDQDNWTDSVARGGARWGVERGRKLKGEMSGLNRSSKLFGRENLGLCHRKIPEMETVRKNNYPFDRDVARLGRMSKCRTARHGGKMSGFPYSFYGLRRIHRFFRRRKVQRIFNPDFIDLQIGSVLIPKVPGWECCPHWYWLPLHQSRSRKFMLLWIPCWFHSFLIILRVLLTSRKSRIHLIQ